MAITIQINVASLNAFDGVSVVQTVAGSLNEVHSVSEVRASLGAYGNRLNSTLSNLAVASENLSAANSRICDVDVAAETSHLMKYKILLQAGTAVLSQANGVPKIALTLLLH